MLSDARMRLDNNVAESTLGLIALGRGESLFVGDGAAVRNPAVLWMVVSTGRQHQDRSSRRPINRYLPDSEKIAWWRASEYFSMFSGDPR